MATSKDIYYCVDVYPYDTRDSDLEGYSSVSTVHFLCHAEAEHNVNKDYRKVENIDARLTDKGKEQCRAIAKRIAKCRFGTVHHDIYTRCDLLCVSPLTRCITSLIRSTKPVLAARPNTPVIAHEYIRDAVDFHCDRRRPVSQIAREFPIVQFDLVPNHDTLWDEYEARLGSAEKFTQHRESAQIYKVADRARNFFKWLGTRPEKHVFVCTHADFLRILMNFGYTDDFKPEQQLDDREHKEDVPVLNFKGEETFAQTVRADFDHCEMRSVRIAFP